MKRKKLFIQVLIIVVLVTSGVIASKKGILKIPKYANKFYVKRVIDGDTIVLGNNERVRYIGINTPETKHPVKGVEWMGKEASEFNRKLVEYKWVELEFDIEIRDTYARLLAYVYVDDVFVNAELVKQGYAQVSTFPPNVKYTSLFLKLQRQARENHKGLWGKK